MKCKLAQCILRLCCCLAGQNFFWFSQHDTLLKQKNIIIALIWYWTNYLCIIFLSDWWISEIDACIFGENILVLEDISFDDCKYQCQVIKSIINYLDLLYNYQDLYYWTSPLIVLYFVIRQGGSSFGCLPCQLMQLD